MHKIKIYSFTFARKGSKGLKNKNLQKLKNKTLIHLSIKQAKKSKLISKVFLSTDCQKISLEGKKAGAIVPFLRPKRLAGDKSSEWLSWQHALNFLKKKKDLPDIFVSIPCTAPLRKMKDVDYMIKKLVKNKNFDGVVAITNSYRNPYFNMIKLSKGSKASILLRNKKNIFRRQDCPKVFDLTTVAFVARPEFILKSKNLFSGKIYGYIVNKKHAIDIDDRIDLKIAESLMNIND